MNNNLFIFFKKVLTSIWYFDILTTLHLKKGNKKIHKNIEIKKKQQKSKNNFKKVLKILKLEIKRNHFTT